MIFSQTFQPANTLVYQNKAGAYNPEDPHLDQGVA